jgi:hypothetical protein
MRPQGVGKLKIFTSSGLEPATSLRVTSCRSHFYAFLRTLEGRFLLHSTAAYPAKHEVHSLHRDQTGRPISKGLECLGRVVTSSSFFETQIFNQWRTGRTFFDLQLLLVPVTPLRRMVD